MILAFDTSTDWLTIAIGQPDHVVAQINEPAPKAHLNRLLPGIDKLLLEADLRSSDIEHIAVGIGPGSFTGVRIAVSTAQGLSHALGRPLIGISTLDVIAAGLAPTDKLIYPVSDAKRQEVYSAQYDGSGQRLTDYQAYEPGNLATELSAAGKPLLMAGDGLVKYSEIFSNKIGSIATIAEPSMWAPKASVLIKLAGEKIIEGRFDPYFEVLPIYIRLSDAEEGLKREK